MKTIEERARQWASIEEPFGGKTELIRGYIAGATDQKQIDEDAMRAIMEENVIKAIEKQRQIDIEKACEWLMTTPMYAKQPSQLVEEFKKAMML